MENDTTDFSKYQEQWQKDQSALAEIDLFPREETLRLMHSHRLSQWSRRLLFKWLQFVMVLLSTGIVLCVMVQSFHYRYLWIGVLMSCLLVGCGVLMGVLIHELYLMGRIRHYRYQPRLMDSYLIRLNALSERRWIRFSHLPYRSSIPSGRLYWGGIVGVATCIVLLMGTMLLTVPSPWNQGGFYTLPSHLYRSQTTYAGVEKVFCNSKVCDAERYYQMASNPINMNPNTYL